MTRNRQQEEANRCTDCDRRIGTNRGRCRECRQKEQAHDPAPEGRCECGQPLYLGRCVRCWARKELGVRR